MVSISIPGAAEAAAVEMEAHGADLIDVGGESTRPGSDGVSEERGNCQDSAGAESASSRVRPGAHLRRHIEGRGGARWRSIEGAALVNDVSGLRYDSALAEVAARYRAGLVLMHAAAVRATCIGTPVYASVAQEVRDELWCEPRPGADRRRRPRGDRARSRTGIREAARAQLRRAGGAAGAGGAWPAAARRALRGKSFLTAAIGERPARQRDMATAAAVTRGRAARRPHRPCSRRGGDG